MDRVYMETLIIVLAASLIAACSDSGNGSGEDATEDDGCAAGLVLCGSLCVDLMTNRNHCGSCGQPCRRGEICTSGTCGSGCVDECTDYDDTRCALYPPNYIETCRDSDGDGCFEWGDLSPCPAGATCEDGRCSSGCPVICDEAGDSRCSADGFGTETCGDYDRDGCLEWGDVVACGGGERCVDGECRYVGPPCGNGNCEDGESCDSCPGDCGDCAMVCAARWEWDLGLDFSVSDNPAGAWSYGWTDRLDGVGFTPGEPSISGPMQGWAGPYEDGADLFPAVMQNSMPLPAPYGGAFYDPGEVAMVPLAPDVQAVVLWTSSTYEPFTFESFDVEAHFNAKGTSPGGIWVVLESTAYQWIDFTAGEAFFQEIMYLGGIGGSTLQFSLGGGPSGVPFDAAAGASIRIRKQMWTFVDDFIPGCNPVGQWEFGYASSTELFSSYAFQGFREVVNPYWSRSGPVSPDGLQSYVWKNNTMGPIDSIITGQFALRPGCFDDPGRCGEEWAVVRWISPFNGHIFITGNFGAGGSGWPDLAIIHESEGAPTALWFRNNALSDEFIDAEALVRTGDTINAVVGDAFEGGDTPLEMHIEVMEYFE